MIVSGLNDCQESSRWLAHFLLINRENHNNGKEDEKMKLGILITTDRHLDHVAGLTRSAVSKGHEVIIFNMDSGTKFLDEPAFTELGNIKGVRVCFCGHSAQHQNVKKDGLPEDIICGSQYNNALMMHAADKVIRL